MISERRYLLSAGQLLVGDAVGRLGSLAVRLVAITVLASDAYNQFSLLGSIYLLGQVIAALNASFSLPAFLTGDPRRDREVIDTVFAMVIVGSAVACAVFLLQLSQINVSTTSFLLFAAAGTLGLVTTAVNGVQIGILLGRGQTGSAARNDAMAGIFKLVPVLLILPFHWASPVLLFWIFVGGQVIATVYLELRFHVAGLEQFRFRNIDFGIFKEFVLQAGQLSLITVTSNLLMHVCRVLLGWQGGGMLKVFDIAVVLYSHVSLVLANLVRPIVQIASSDSEIDPFSLIRKSTLAILAFSIIVFALAQVALEPLRSVAAQFALSAGFRHGWDIFLDGGYLAAVMSLGAAFDLGAGFATGVAVARRSLGPALAAAALACLVGIIIAAATSSIATPLIMAVILVVYPVARAGLMWMMELYRKNVHVGRDRQKHIV